MQGWIQERDGYPMLCSPKSPFRAIRYSKRFQPSFGDFSRPQRRGQEVSPKCLTHDVSLRIARALSTMPKLKRFRRNWRSSRCPVSEWLLQHLSSTAALSALLPFAARARLRYQARSGSRDFAAIWTLTETACPMPLTFSNDARSSLIKPSGEYS